MNYLNMGLPLAGFQELEAAALLLEKQELDQASEGDLAVIERNKAAFFAKLSQLIQHIQTATFKPIQKDVAAWVFRAASAVLKAQHNNIFHPSAVDRGYEKISVTIQKINRLVDNYLVEMSEIPSLGEIIAICATEEALSTAEIINLSLQEPLVNLSYEEYACLVRQSLAERQWNLIKVLSRESFQNAFSAIYVDFIFDWLASMAIDDTVQMLTFRDFLMRCAACLNLEKTFQNEALEACLTISLQRGSLKVTKILVECLGVNLHEIKNALLYTVEGKNLGLIIYVLEEQKINTLFDLELACRYALSIKSYILIDYLIEKMPTKLDLIPLAVDYKEWGIVRKLFQIQEHFSEYDFYSVIKSGVISFVQELIDAGVEITASMCPEMLKAALKSGSLEMLQFLNARFSIMPSMTSMGKMNFQRINAFQQMLEWSATNGGVHLMRFLIATYPSLMLLKNLKYFGFNGAVAKKVIESRDMELLRYVVEELQPALQESILSYLGQDNPASTCQNAYLFSLIVDKEHKLYFDQIAKGHMNELSLKTLKSIKNLLLTGRKLDCAITGAIRRQSIIQYLFSKFHNGKLPPEVLVLIANYIDFSKPLQKKTFRTITDPWA